MHTEVSKESVLLLGDYRQSLTVARSLHRAGYRVMLGSADPRPVTAMSRYIAERWQHPPLSDSQAWQAAIRAFCSSRPDVRIIYPIGDLEIAASMPIASSLPALVVAVEERVFELCQHKRSLLELAARVGVATERWELVTEPSGLADAAERIGYPVAIKPDGGANEELGFKAVIANGPADLDRINAVSAFPPAGFIIQQFGNGPRHNVYFIARHGRLLGSGEIVTLRTDCPDGTGLSVEGLSVQPSPLLLEHTKALIAALEYTGAGCAQFLVDETTGDTCFLEINSRLGANCAAVCRCGLDLPKLFIEVLRGPIAPQPAAKTGHSYVWLLGDVEGLLDSRKRLSVSSVFWWIARSMMALLRAQDHITWDWRDPFPSIVMMKRLVSRMLRRTARSLGLGPPRHSRQILIDSRVTGLVRRISSSGDR